MGTRDTSATKKGAKSAISLLKRERERRAWTQSDIAERIGTTQINVSRWENGTTIPSPHFRQKLAELFGKSIEELDLLLKNVEEHTEETTTTLHTSDPHSISPAPPIWNVPYRRNPFFTGRDEVLINLHNTLSDTKRRALPLAISGLGGIGKTQIAVEYAYRYSKNYYHIFWINATTHDTLNADFVTLATVLDLPEQHEQDQGTVIRAVKRWQANHTNWLLILDNVDDLGMIVDVLPTHGTGEVLLTTRLQALGTVAQCIEIENMGLDEGVKFLLCRTKIMAPEGFLDQVMGENLILAREIVLALDGLPLALDQAGAYIEETRCGLSQYCKLYATRRKALLLRRGSSQLDHPTSVAATWSLSFYQIEQENLAAADLLRLLAFLDSEAIPEEIILSGAAELGPELGPVASDPLQIDTIIELLLRYSLIRRFPDAKYLSIHRLVQIVLKDGMERETQRVWAERAIRAVNSTFPDVELQTWQLQTQERCQRYLPHVQACAIHSDEYELVFPEAARLFNEAASYLGTLASYKQSELLLLKALAIRQRVLQAPHPDTARTLNALGRLYLNSGKYHKAEHVLQEALAIRLEVLGEEHLDIAETLYNLASLYRVLGDYTKSEPLFLQTLHIRKALLGTRHPLVARSYYGLARLYLSQEKHNQAEEFCKQALYIQEHYLKDDYLPMLASTLNVLAKIYQGKKQFDRAEEINMRALYMRESISGKNHPHIAIILNSLSEIYHAQGRYDQAHPLITRAFTIFEEALGPEHPYMAYSFSNLAENFYLQGDYTQAESSYQKALIIREQHLGFDHPRTASTYFDLARLYSATKLYEKAESFYRKALSIYKHTLGSNHPTVTSILEEYITLLRKLKRENEANELATIYKQIK